MVTWEDWAKNVNERLEALSTRIDDLFRKMALETQVQSLRTDLSELKEELVEAIFLERMQVHIVEKLKSGAKTEREITKTLPDFLSNRLHRNAFDMAWKGFVKAGVLLPISHGRGHARTWELSLLKTDSSVKGG